MTGPAAGVRQPAERPPRPIVPPRNRRQKPGGPTGDSRHETVDRAVVNRHVQQHHRHVERHVDRVPGRDGLGRQPIQTGDVDEPGRSELPGVSPGQDVEVGPDRTVGRQRSVCDPREAQAELVRRLETGGRLPVTRDRLAEAWALLDETLDALAARYHEDLAPAIDRVWTDEIEKLRIDLKGWLQEVADEDGEWVPIRAELGFGLPPGPGRDPRTAIEPVRLDDGWTLHGVVDLVEARARPTAAGALRVTDHKTGRNRTAERMVVGRGEVLQPVLYGLAVEQVLRRPVEESRLFFATAAGGYDTRAVVLDETARRCAIEALSIIDRAIETGVVLPAPRRDACARCDYRVVCGPWEETRARRKDATKLVDLQALRRLP